MSTLGRLALFVVAGAGLSCAAGSSGNGVGAGSGVGGGSSSGSQGSAHGSTTSSSTTASSSGAGGSSPVGDSVPTSAVSFFQGPACPSGWAPYVPADGRFIVPTVASAPAGITANTPLMPGEDRVHAHTVAATFTLTSVSYAGAAGGGNGGVAGAGAVTMTTGTQPASTGLPYVQLLACRKSGAAVAHASPIPRGVQMFFDRAACPTGWAQSASTQGRLVVGLPDRAPQDVTFGGAAISGVDGGADVRTHGHSVTATLTTSAHGIALASGCCADGYGANGTLTAATETPPVDTGLPILTLLSCEKQ